jgi:proline iminopeptidase
MFGDVAAMLSPALRVVRWDQRGCGRSERRGPYSVAQSVADLDTVRRHVTDGPVAILGHSWGAQLALRYALDLPGNVSELIYVAGTGLGWGWREQFERNATGRQASHRGRRAELTGTGRTGTGRTESEDRELAILQWSAEFADPAVRTRYATRMATPWFGINYECNATINAELKQTWCEGELIAACEQLALPVLIIDGAQDIRPRDAVDSLEQALPMVTRVVLPDAGHLPWFEAPEEFRSAVLAKSA